VSRPRTVAGVLSGLSGFYAFSVLPMAQVYAILFAAPLLITALSIPVLGERVGVHRWFAVVLPSRCMPRVCCLQTSHGH